MCGSGGLAICTRKLWQPNLLQLSSELSNLLQGCVAMEDLRMVWDVLFNTNPERLRALVAGREQPCDADEQHVASLFEVRRGCMQLQRRQRRLMILLGTSRCMHCSAILMIHQPGVLSANVLLIASRQQSYALHDVHHFRVFVGYPG